MITFDSIKPPTSHSKWLLSTCLAVVALCFTQHAALADWPSARGDEHSSGVAATTLAAEPELLWKYVAEESDFEATPVVFDGTLYLGDADGTVHAIELATGASVWKQTFEKTNFFQAAVVDNKAVYLADEEGFVHALDRTSGKELWKYDTDNQCNAFPIRFEETLLITTEAGTCLAIHRVTGKLLWEFSIAEPLRGAPSVVAGHAMLAGCDARLHAINLADGTEASTLEIDSQTGCTAAVQANHVYFGTESGLLTAIDATDITAPSTAWTYQDPERSNGIRTTAAVSPEHVIYSNQAKRVYCLDRIKGTLLWKKPMRSRIESSPIIVGKQVVVATSRGRVQLLSLADGETLWEYEAGGTFLASPIALENRLLLANTNGTLYCFGKPDKK